MEPRGCSDLLRQPLNVRLSRRFSPTPTSRQGSSITATGPASAVSRQERNPGSQIVPGRRVTELLRGPDVALPRVEAGVPACGDDDGAMRVGASPVDGHVDVDEQLIERLAPLLSTSAAPNEATNMPWYSGVPGTPRDFWLMARLPARRRPDLGQHFGDELAADNFERCGIQRAGSKHRAEHRVPADGRHGTGS